MKRTFGTFSLFSLILLVSAPLAGAQEIKPTEEQTSIKWGKVSEEDGVRKVVSTEEEYHEHNTHGPIPDSASRALTDGLFATRSPHGYSTKNASPFQLSPSSNPSINGQFYAITPQGRGIYTLSFSHHNLLIINILSGGEGSRAPVFGTPNESFPSELSACFGLLAQAPWLPEPSDQFLGILCEMFSE